MFYGMSGTGIIINDDKYPFLFGHNYWPKKSYEIYKESDLKALHQALIHNSIVYHPAKCHKTIKQLTCGRSRFMRLCGSFFYCVWNK